MIFQVCETSVVFCTDLWGKEPHTHTSRRGHSGDIRELMWCNGSTLAQNARDVGSCPALDKVFPIFVTPMTQAYKINCCMTLEMLVSTGLSNVRFYSIDSYFLHCSDRWLIGWNEHIGPHSWSLLRAQGTDTKHSPIIKGLANREQGHGHTQANHYMSHLITLTNNKRTH